jgi:protein-disulfide isomerase
MSTSGWGAIPAVPISPDSDHIRGSLEAPVSLVEYGDDECPFCGRAYPVVEQVREAAGDALMSGSRPEPSAPLRWRDRR